MFDVDGKEFKKSSYIRMKGSAKGKVLEVGYSVQSLGAGIDLGAQEESTTKAR